MGARVTNLRAFEKWAGGRRRLNTNFFADDTDQVSAGGRLVYCVAHELT
jgi:hypothetical protein